MANRINLLNENEASQQAQELLKQVKSKFGKIPNVFKMMANSSAVLQSYLSFSGALSTGKLDAQIQERLALMFSQINDCEYCLGAHSVIAKGAGLSENEIMLARQGHSADEKAAKALQFAYSVYNSAGHVNDAELEAVKQAGFSSEEILEIIAAVSLNLLTNTLNAVAQTEMDFPKAKTCSTCNCGCSC